MDDGVVSEWFGLENDKLAAAHRERSRKRLKLLTRAGQLKEFFRIEILGGHREFYRTHSTDRSCPGTYGMTFADMMRRDMGFSAS